MRILSVAAIFWALSVLAASAATAPAAQNSTMGNSFLPGSNSKDPVSIEADQLVYSDKEGKATYSGNVVLIQGPSKLTCSQMVIFIDKGANAGSPGAAPTPTPSAKPSPAASGSPDTGSQVRHMDCSGPVTVVSKTQTATGDSAIYDKPQNKVWLIGNVTLSDGPNVTKGDKLTYDLTTGEAHVETKPSQGKPGRVWSQFVPGSDKSADAAPEPAPGAAKPASKPTPAKTPAKP